LSFIAIGGLVTVSYANRDLIAILPYLMAYGVTLIKLSGNAVSMD